MKIQKKHLNIVKLASKDATRYQLNSVFVEVKDGKGSLTATDGKVLGHLTFNSQDDDETRETLLSSTGINDFLKGNSKVSEQINDVELEDIPDGIYSKEQVKVEGGSLKDSNGRTQDVEYIDGKFPDYRSVFPENNAGDGVETCEARFNPFYLRDAIDSWIKTLGITEKATPLVTLQFQMNGGKDNKYEGKINPTFPIVMYNEGKIDGVQFKALVMPLVSNPEANKS